MRRPKRGIPALPDQSDMTVDQFRAAMTDLCERGLITCTHGRPGDDDATYALAWIPLDNPENYSPHIRELHAQNMAALIGGVH